MQVRGFIGKLNEVNDCLDWERLLKETYEFEETRVLIDQYPAPWHLQGQLFSCSDSIRATVIAHDSAEFVFLRKGIHEKTQQGPTNKR